MEQKKINKIILEKTPLFKSLLGLMIKDGKKSLATQILKEAFIQASFLCNLPSVKISIKLAESLLCSVETRKLKIKKTTYLVPFIISEKRKYFLISKWILTTVREDKRRVSFKQKLVEEFILILKKNKGETISKKNLNITQATKNKANIHYRW